MKASPSSAESSSVADANVVKEPYVPALDGVRAIAVILVLLVHLHHSTFSFGWVGVIVFFVLSGYLITRILISTRTSPSFFRTFYLRRSIRIFPIYYLTLGAIAYLGLVRGESITRLPFYLVYSQGLANQWTGVHAGFPSVFDHSWSLAVEEQFYLFWPVIVYLLPMNALRGLCVLLVALGWIVRLAYSAYYQFNPELASYMVYTPLESNWDALGMGAFLATLSSKDDLHVNHSRLRVASFSWIVSVSIFAASSLGYINWSNSMLAQTSGLIFRVILTPAIGYFLYCVIDNRNSPASRVLALAPIRRVGKISYGIYLFHFPLFYFVERIAKGHLHATPFWLIDILKVCVSYVFASLSWQLLEEPINRLKSRFPYAGSRDGP